MKNSFIKTLVVLTASILLPGICQGDHIFVALPSGNTWSDTNDPAPKAVVTVNEWETDAGFGELTGSSVYPPVADSDTTEAQGEIIEVKITIPKAGNWWLWAHYNFPFPTTANSFWVLDPNGLYVGPSTAPSETAAPFLNDNFPPFKMWAWDGSDDPDTSINETSKGSALGNLAAGDYILQFYRAETSEGTGSVSADPKQNPHLELLYLTNVSADDRPSNEMFLKTQPYSAVRTFNPVVFSGFGGPIDVKIEVQQQKAAAGQKVTVTENVSTDLLISQISPSVGTAKLDGAKIVWDIPALTGNAVLTYTASVSSGRTDPFTFKGTLSSGGKDQTVSGQADLELQSFFIFETFSYPLNGSDNGNKGKSVSKADQQRGQNWAGDWTAGSGVKDTLDEKTIDAGLVVSQPQEYNPGNFSLKITGESGDTSLRRKIAPVAIGELWLSFTFMEEGPANEHWSGLSFFDSKGEEVSFVGKPWNGQYCGIGNLPGGDSLATGKDYKVPHHFLVRYVLTSKSGNSDSVYLWIDPDKADRLDTYDAGGSNNDNITDIAEIRLARGAGGGTSGYWDNIFITSVPALPPAGAGRLDLKLDDPKRSEDLPAWDVVAIDQISDTVSTSTEGYGHDNGNDHYLVVSGFIYTDNADGSGDQHVAWGLPPDHISGLNGHLLGDYNDQSNDKGLKNSMKFRNNSWQTGPFTFDVVPNGKYKELRAVMTIGNGDGQLFVTLNYADGSKSEGFFHADDWYDDPPGLQFTDVFQLINGMNRLSGSGSAWDGRFDPAFFENATPADPNKILKSVTLELDNSVDSDCGFNLFDVLAIPEAVVVGVNDWMMY